MFKWFLMMWKCNKLYKSEFLRHFCYLLPKLIILLLLFYFGINFFDTINSKCLFLLLDNGCKKHWFLMDKLSFVYTRAIVIIIIIIIIIELNTLTS